jgi:hypothetical protein
MKTLRHLSLMASLIAAGAAALPVSALAQSCTCPPAAEEGASAPRAAIYADEEPPPLPVYEQPPIPEPGYLWTPGYWSWNSYEYFWVPGVWVEPPHPGLLWTPGYWGFVGGAFLFHRGYWGEHVGFYGGVNYGFGYGGAGYEGGRWDNGRFFYNRAVNNVRNVRITNVYDQQVTINNTTINRVSYNGGPHGVAAKPTEAEEAAAKEAHVAPTPAQTHNARVASRLPAAFVSENKGKPPVAAAAKPGEFKGASVVHAQAAGGPVNPRPEPADAEREKPQPAHEPGAQPAAERPGEKHELRGAEPTKPEGGAADGQAKPEEPRKAEPAHKPEAETPRPERSEPTEPRKPKEESRRPEPAHTEPPREAPHRAEPPREAPHRAEPPREAPHRAEPPREAPHRAEPRPAPHPGGACHPGQPGCPK